MKHMLFVLNGAIFSLGILIGVECISKGQMALGAFLVLGQLGPKLKLVEAHVGDKISHTAQHVMLEEHAE